MMSLTNIYFECTYKYDKIYYIYNNLICVGDIYYKAFKFVPYN